MTRGRIINDDGTIFLENKRLQVSNWSYQFGFSPILSPGDELDVKFDGTPSNPHNIIMTIPQNKAPYTFVPVVETGDRLLVRPVFHDGTKNGEDLYTGLMHCELKTLTPLLVGHYSYKVKEADSQKIETGNYDPNKTILEPLFLEGTPESAVILPGTSIKGMVRHNIGAMFNAPMERVTEQYFSYRPNLALKKKPDRSDRYECREALVEQILKTEGKITTIKITILPQGRHAIFMAEKIFNNLDCDIGKTISGNEVTGAGFGIGQGMKRYRLFKNGGSLPDPEYKICRYRPGIDGEGELNEVQEGKSRKDDYAVLVRVQSIRTVISGIIDTPCIEQFQRTQLELADVGSGHRSRSDFKTRNPLWERVRDNLRQIHPNQLIYTTNGYNGTFSKVWKFSASKEVSAFLWRVRESARQFWIAAVKEPKSR